MLITEKVNVKWNAKTKKHYEDLGYNYTKMGDEFEVDTRDLTRGSNVFVDVECDYCHKKYSVRWYSYKLLQTKLIHKDCCGDPNCTFAKSEETLNKLYGTSNIRDIPGVNEKIKKTNLEKYGVENPFASDEIKNKIKETNMERYGVEWYTQTEQSKERYRQTCLQKYGVSNYCYTEEFIKSMSGENSPLWKGDDNKIPRERYRESAQYRKWRKSVFDRDLYTCQCCGARSGQGKCVRLEAHHINNWASSIDERYKEENGITLCYDCHKSFHSIYGARNNNYDQLVEFININKKLLDEKIC